MQPHRQWPIFVYGTLRPGGKNYPRFLQGRTLRETPATVRARLYFVADLGYSYIVPEPGTVHGELMEISPEFYNLTLRQLDALEEYDPGNESGSVYLRRRATVGLEDGRQTEAWIYFWNLPQVKGELIPSGDFRKR